MTTRSRRRLPVVTNQARSKWPYVELIVGIVFGCIVLRQLVVTPDGLVAALLDGRRKDLYNAILGLSGSLLGFVLATLAIVIGYAQSERFTVLRASRWHSSLYQTFVQCVRALLAAVVFSLFGLFGDRDDNSVPIIAGLTAASVVISLTRLGRTTYVFQKVVQIVTTSASREPGN